jgi:hypothetical protein
MIPLLSKVLSPAASAELARQQRAVDKPVAFADRVAKAQSRWKSKGKSKAGKPAFTEITKALVRMTVSANACSYCEHNEGGDIEHIYPKSWFPERAFAWDNYLWACKSCNTTFKNSGFAVFSPSGSATLVSLTSQTPGPPPTSDGVLLNPRTENPLDFLELDFRGGLAFVPRFGLGPREYRRAVYTRELLHLNRRPELRKARAIAHRHFIGLLREFVEVKDSATLAELKAAVNIPHIVAANRPFARQRAEIMVSLRRAVWSHPHPSVWHEIKKQYVTLDQAPALFAKAPEALTW